MAKKLTILINEVQRASNALKDFHIEHVTVRYPKTEKAFIVVLNKDAVNAKTAIEKAEIKIRKMKSIRHYASLTTRHDYYQPKFDCKCRGCGKQFTSLVKEAVWCSTNCKSNFRKEKRRQNE